MLILSEVSLVLNRIQRKLFFHIIEEDWKYEPIVRWNNLAKNMPWGALILLGAGLSVASAFTVCEFEK